MTAGTVTPYRPLVPAGRDGFAQLVRAEWTKFRTVRGWVIGMLVAIGVTVALGVLVGKESVCSVQNLACPAPPVGPGGEPVTDSFYFVHQPLDGNGSITVRVTSLTGLYSTHVVGQAGQGLADMQPGLQPWSKAGIILKENLSQGSAYAAVMVTGGNGVRMQWNYTQDTPGLGGAISAANPRWLRLTRSGGTITGYDSADGTHWAKVGTAALALPSTVQAGLFAASPRHQVPTTSFGGGGTKGGPSLATAAFDHVSLQGSWPHDAWNGAVMAPSGAGAGPVQAIKAAESFRQAGGSFTVTGSGDIAPQTPSGAGSTIAQTLTGTFAALIAVVVVAAMFMTAEYRRGLIRVTFAASPRRGRVLAAKAIVTAAVTFVAGLVAVAITIPLGERLLRENGNPIYPVSAATELRIAAGTAALLAVAAVLALAVGTVLRRSAGAVTAVIVVIVLPYILGTVPGILPAGAEGWLLRLTPAAAFAIQQSAPAYLQVIASYVPSNGYFPLAPWAGFAVLCAWAALALAVAAYLLRRRDA
jgi:ABC-type transport system involved in multi-copper enzyme maturation permease subunit/regulation of enolase protein 1 (concanavalin A-like superfamily)